MKTGVLLDNYTTFKIGGTAEFFAAVKSEDDLLALVETAKAKGLPIHILGTGSNVLVSDEGIKGLVIKNEIIGLNIVEDDEEVILKAGAGVDWDGLVQESVKKGWWGMENLSGIPGTVGATPVQNVGAYGVEVSDLITEVRVFDTKKMAFYTLTNTDCKFSYRDSIFKAPEGRSLIITAVSYRLKKDGVSQLSYKDLANYFSDDNSETNLQSIREAVLEIRAKKFPDWKKLGTAGSFFKNPLVTEDKLGELKQSYPDLPAHNQGNGKYKVSLGYILDKICGLRGFRLSNVGLSEKQALVLISYGDSSAKEVLDFSDLVTKKVFEKTKINIEREINLW